MSHNLDTQVGLLLLGLCLAITLGILAWGPARNSARGDTYPAPPLPEREYETSADRWRPHQHTDRDEWPFDQELDDELHHAEDYLSACADEQERGGAA